MNNQGQLYNGTKCECCQKHIIESAFQFDDFKNLASLQQATAQTYDQMDIARDQSQQAREKVTGMLFDETVDLGPTTVSNPMVSPDIGFVNMLRYGIVALQLLPENSSAG